MMKKLLLRALPAMVVGGLLVGALSCTPAKAPSVESVAKVLCDTVPVLVQLGTKLPDEVLEYIGVVCHLTAEEAEALKATSGDSGAE